jgi:hypothetical protein
VKLDIPVQTVILAQAVPQAASNRHVDLLPAPAVRRGSTQVPRQLQQRRRAKIVLLEPSSPRQETWRSKIVGSVLQANIRQLLAAALAWTAWRENMSSR